MAHIMRPKQALEGPLRLDLSFYMPRPKAHPKAVYHASRPDFDNLAKSVCDSLTKARWWTDDSRIAIATIFKRYETPTDRPGVRIDVEEIK